MADKPFSDTYFMRLPEGTLARVKKLKLPHEKVSEFMRRAVFEALTKADADKVKRK